MTDKSDSAQRFVVLLHEVGPQFMRTTETHLDWLFESGEALTTWSTKVVTDFGTSFELPCHQLPDHRLIYLDHEGEIGGGRGSVRRLLAGEFTHLKKRSGEVAFHARLAWQLDGDSRYARVEITQRRLGTETDFEPAFEFRFSLE